MPQVVRKEDKVQFVDAQLADAGQCLLLCGVCADYDGIRLLCKSLLKFTPGRLMTPFVCVVLRMAGVDGQRDQLCEIFEDRRGPFADLEVDNGCRVG